MVQRRALSIHELVEMLNGENLDIQDKSKAKDKADSIKTLALILAILCFIFGVYLLLRVISFLIIIFGKDDGLDFCPCLKSYRRFIGKDYIHCMEVTDNKVVSSRKKGSASKGPGSNKASDENVHGKSEIKPVASESSSKFQGRPREQTGSREKTKPQEDTRSQEKSKPQEETRSRKKSSQTMKPVLMSIKEG